MDSTLFDRLLYEGESTTLDFKKEQYSFAEATDEEKSELLKDILGFANAWRRSDAYILIGVEEVQGGRSVVMGVSEHLQDHTLQQFVNNLTNRPIRFGYEAFEFEGKQVGVIRIEQQQRPIYLRRDYGKLQKEKVFVRRGSSTDPQKPAGIDEIAMMGSGQSSAMQKASLKIEFADTERERSLGERINWAAEFCRMPEAKDIPVIKSRGMEYSLHDRVNARYFHDLAEYEFLHRLCRKVRLVVSNVGEVPASDVRIEIAGTTQPLIIVMKSSAFPRPPETRKSLHAFAMADLKLRNARPSPGDLEIEQNEHDFNIEVECGNLQPGRKVWSEAFYLGIGWSGEAKLAGSLLAENLPAPQEFALTIDANISNEEMTVDQLVALGAGGEME